MQLRVATYNFRDLNERKPSEQRLAAGQVLRELDCDVVSLQEVGSGALLGQELQREVPGRYQGVTLPGNDAHGHHVGLASKARITGVNSHREHRFSLTGSAQPESFARDLLEVDLELPGGVPLKVFTVHFASGAGEAAELQRQTEALQARALIYEAVRELPHRNYMVMGDFSDSPDSPAARALTDIDDQGWGLVDLAAYAGNSTPTYPTSAEQAKEQGSQRVDFILASRELAGKLTSVSVHRTPSAHVASDHFPLTATFTL